jgi:hypothetical protein
MTDNGSLRLVDFSTASEPGFGFGTEPKAALIPNLPEVLGLKDKVAVRIVVFVQSLFHGLLRTFAKVVVVLRISITCLAADRDKSSDAFESPQMPSLLLLTSAPSCLRATVSLITSIDSRAARSRRSAISPCNANTSSIPGFSHGDSSFGLSPVLDGGFRVDCPEPSHVCSVGFGQ